MWEIDMWNDQVQYSSTGVAFYRAGEGPPVVLLHGIPGSAKSWRLVAADLPGALDVIVPDLLGFGASSRPIPLEALHAGAQAAALDALMGELGVMGATVIGHDFGGPCALALVSRRPSAVGALGLLATNAFTDTPIPFPLSVATWPILGAAARRVLFSAVSLRMMLRRGVARGTTPPNPADHLGDRQQQRAIATIFSGSLTRLAELYRSIEDQLHNLSVPVFVGWGDHDPFCEVREGQRLAQAVGTELRVYHGAGHFLPYERPEDVAADIVALTRNSSRI
jgi:pimeloyl-ACP methyl ester carboxylesterase